MADFLTDAMSKKLKFNSFCIITKLARHNFIGQAFDSHCDCFLNAHLEHVFSLLLLLLKQNICSHCCSRIATRLKVCAKALIKTLNTHVQQVAIDFSPNSSAHKPTNCCCRPIYTLFSLMSEAIQRHLWAETTTEDLQINYMEIGVITSGLLITSR